MKENIDKLVTWLKQVHSSELNIRACITGSCMLDYFENQDVDLFVYDEKSLRNILYTLHFNDMFYILDKKEKFKFDKYINSPYDNKPTILTIKFIWNTCIPLNIIYKKNCYSIYDVLSSFDLDIVAKGFDLETQKYLDLTDGSQQTKIGNWNKWNTNYYNSELWESRKILRQISRGIKYYKRGYNTDPLFNKYLEIIDDIQNYQDIFGKNTFSEKLKTIKNNTKYIKKIIELWLEAHSITDEQLELLETKIKEI
jgi:hypothetical protein